MEFFIYFVKQAFILFLLLYAVLEIETVTQYFKLKTPAVFQTTQQKDISLSIVWHKMNSYIYSAILLSIVYHQKNRIYKTVSAENKIVAN